MKPLFLTLFLIPPLCLVAFAPAHEMSPSIAPHDNTPMLFAAAYGELGAVEWFVAHGADPKAKNSHNHTGGDMAKDHNSLRTDRFFNEAVERGLAKRKKGRRLLRATRQRTDCLVR